MAHELRHQPSLVLYVDQLVECPVGSPTFTVRTKLHQFSPREVAEELCLMDAELLRKIVPEELENGAWMKKDKLTRAPNILAMVHASNDLAMLVPTEVLNEPNISAMAKCISAFIKIASKCYRLNNYNSLKAILAGLQCTPIYRLKMTWREVPSKRKKKFDILSKLMSEECSWKAYTKHLNSILDKNTPCIPFLGVLLTVTVQYNLQHAASDFSREFGTRKLSGVEDYTLLEAITVRNRLESIRKRSASLGRSFSCVEPVVPSPYNTLKSPRVSSILQGNDSDSDTGNEATTSILENSLGEEDAHTILIHSNSLQSDENTSILPSEDLPKTTVSSSGCSNGDCKDESTDLLNGFGPKCQHTELDSLSEKNYMVNAVQLREKRKDYALSRHKGVSQLSEDFPSESASESEEEGEFSGFLLSRSFDGLKDACTNWDDDLDLFPTARVASLDALHVSESSSSTLMSEYSTESSNQSNSSLLSSEIQPVMLTSQPPSKPAFTASPSTPMRKRSSVLSVGGGSYKRVSVVQTIPVKRFSRTSQESIDYKPSVEILTKRRRPSRLLTVLQAHSSPGNLLARYQLMSFGCSTGILGSPEVRGLIRESPRNTEYQNYKLSHLIEPV